MICSNRQLLAIFLTTAACIAVSSFIPTIRHSKAGLSIRQAARYRELPCLFAKGSSSDDDDDDEEALALQDDDWRAFRAMLVKGEKTEPDANPSSGYGNDYNNSSYNKFSADGDLDGIGSLFPDGVVLDTTKKEEPILPEGMTPLDPSQWAYDSGGVIEQGAVILGGVEQAFGFGLRQQYFHKAAILVLDHDENMFTKGIILNRPSDLMLEDDINEGKLWRVWFGGDVEGINAKHPAIVCLHSIKDEKATKASIPVMKDIQWTTFDNAKKLVKAGVAEVNDFWVFVGYAGWGRGQLKGELISNSWYMVATDSQTLLKELARQGEGSDPRDAGLDTWSLLMNMIGRADIAKQVSGGFDDLMMKEWAFSNLLSAAAGGGAGRQERKPDEFSVNPELVRHLMSRILDPSREKAAPIIEGALVRASSADRSPFLLDNQEFHKSVVLVLLDDDSGSIGVILNRPSSKGLDIQVDDNRGGKRTVSIPMRFGGQYQLQHLEPLLWLHCSQTLRDTNVGTPVGAHQEHEIFKCSAQDVGEAIGQGIAQPHDFIVVSGVSVWEKSTAGDKQGMEGALEARKFEMIPTSRREQVWSNLQQQREVLTKMNLNRNLAIAEEAWAAGGIKQKAKVSTPEPITGLGEGFDEEDDTYVYQSDTKVSDLSFEALRSWCATFLLGLPNIGK